MLEHLDCCARPSAVPTVGISVEPEPDEHSDVLVGVDLEIGSATARLSLETGTSSTTGLHGSGVDPATRVEMSASVPDGEVDSVVIDSG